MGYTNSTPHYNLPQYVASDKPSWLGDFNSAMLKIDTEISGAAADAGAAVSQATAAVQQVSAITTRVNQLDADVKAAVETATTASGNASAAIVRATTAEDTAGAAKARADEAYAKAVEADKASEVPHDYQCYGNANNTTYGIANVLKYSKYATLSVDVLVKNVPTEYNEIANGRRFYPLLQVNNLNIFNLPSMVVTTETRASEFPAINGSIIRSIRTTNDNGESYYINASSENENLVCYYNETTRKTVIGLIVSDPISVYQRRFVGNNLMRELGEAQ